MISTLLIALAFTLLSAAPFLRSLRALRRTLLPALILLFGGICFSQKPALNPLSRFLTIEAPQEENRFADLPDSDADGLPDAIERSGYYPIETSFTGWQPTGEPLPEWSRHAASSRARILSTGPGFALSLPNTLCPGTLWLSAAGILSFEAPLNATTPQSYPLDSATAQSRIDHLAFAQGPATLIPALGSAISLAADDFLDHRRITIEKLFLGTTTNISADIQIDLHRSGLIRLRYRLPENLNLAATHAIGYQTHGGGYQFGSITNRTEIILAPFPPTNPTNPDTDSDGIGDLEELRRGLNPANPDSDGDGIEDGTEVALGLDPANPDTDGDGIPDGAEITLGLNPLDPLDATLDPDSDDLTNLQEYHHGTDPNRLDTDLDGYSDSWEILHGTNPLDPDDPDPRRAQTNICTYVTGDSPGGISKTNRWTSTIPPGQTHLYIVYSHSFSNPPHPDDPATDHLQYTIRATGQSNPLHGSFTAAERLSAWAQATSQPALHFRNAYVEDYGFFSAPPDSPLTITTTLIATNTDTNQTYSSLIVTTHPLTFTQHNTPNITLPQDSTTDFNGPRGPRPIPSGGTAWITGQPTMPNLTANLSELPPETRIHWALKIQTERPEKRLTTDNRTYTGPTTTGTNAYWHISTAFQTFSADGTPTTEFIGGDCLLQPTLSTVTTPSREIRTAIPFKIRGKNPPDATVETTMTALIDSRFHPFARYIARHESRAGSTIYNQFNTQKTIEGTLNYGTPNGWGIAQIDRKIPVGATINPVTTLETWNWLQNVVSMDAVLREKRRIHDRMVGYFRENYQTNSVIIQTENGPTTNNFANSLWSDPPTSFTYHGVTLSAADWGTIVLYNGADLGDPITLSVLRNGVKISLKVHPIWRFNPITGEWIFRDNSDGYAVKIAKEISNTAQPKE